MNTMVLSSIMRIGVIADTHGLLRPEVDDEQRLA